MKQYTSCEEINVNISWVKLHLEILPPCSSLSSLSLSSSSILFHLNVQMRLISLWFHTRSTELLNRSINTVVCYIWYRELST